MTSDDTLVTNDTLVTSDTLVIGSGIAGLLTALELQAQGRSVILACKGPLRQSNTQYAQGGIAVATSDDDRVDLHIADTLVAGAGLCVEEAVQVLCEEGPQRIADLMRIGVAFDLNLNGNTLARGREAAHNRARVLHAGGDATGAYIVAALAAAIQTKPITLLEHAFLTELLVQNGTVYGARFLDTSSCNTSSPNSVGQPFEVRAAQVVLATGGAGQAFAHTTNPAVATGDGVAAAYRAGAVVSDAEFFQFHPTVLELPGVPAFLVSEAVRGEGALLRNEHGERFMTTVHPQAELAPRDVVARAILMEMRMQCAKPVLLDATALGAEFLARRFPNIDRFCRNHGLDWSTSPLPVTPAAHYWMGGLRTDLWGRTSIQGLYACGEVACTGVHGANRLASNSLLEGAVFAHRVAQAIARPPSTWPFFTSIPLGTPEDNDGDELVSGRSIPELVSGRSIPELGGKEALQHLLWDHVGMERDAHGLRIAGKQLQSWRGTPPLPPTQATQEMWEMANLVTVGRLMVAAALERTESRGAHFRSDHSTTKSAWERRLSYSLAPTGGASC